MSIHSTDVTDRKGPPEKAETRANKRDFSFQSSLRPWLKQVFLTDDSAEGTLLLWGKLAQSSGFKVQFDGHP